VRSAGEAISAAEPNEKETNPVKRQALAVTVASLLSIIAVGQCYAHQRVSAASIPEPATLTLFGTGLLGLAGLARLRRGKKSTQD
jgi:hypothetical protein